MGILVEINFNVSFNSNIFSVQTKSSDRDVGENFLIFTTFIIYNVFRYSFDNHRNLLADIKSNKIAMEHDFPK